MTKQATFNKVVRHLRKQGKSAQRINGACAYRAPGGLKCAVGCLIPDEMYKRSWDAKNLVVTDSPVRKIVESLGHDVDLLRELQEVHDYYEPFEWERELRSVAKHHRLTYTKPAKKAGRS